MPWYRVLATVGKAMMITGLLVLGFVAYELWGTGLHTQRAQQDLESAYAEQFEELQQLVDDLEPTGPDAGSDPDGDEPVDPFMDPEVLAFLATLPPPEEGDPIGRIEIPSLGLNWWVVEGTDLRYLRDGPGHFLGTSMPGQPGNAALAGHRTTYGAPFHNLDRLEVGAEIRVSTFQGTFVYEVLPIPIVDGAPQWRPPPPVVTIESDASLDAFREADETSVDAGDATLEDADSLAGSPEGIARPTPLEFDPATIEGYAAHFIVQPEASEILADYGDDRLTLMACHPKYSARQRIVVSAELVGPAAPPVPREPQETPGEVLPDEVEPVRLLEGGDPTARNPMILWGLTTALIALAAQQIGKRWRRWPIYVAATPPFLVALWSFYANLDALLPAGL